MLCSSNWNSPEEKNGSLGETPHDIEIGQPPLELKSRLIGTLKYAGVLIILLAILATFKIGASSNLIIKRDDPSPAPARSLSPSSSLLTQLRKQSDNNTLPSPDEVNSHDPYEIFAVYDSDVVKASYGSPVYSSTLFNHVFGNSEGSPYVGQLPTLPAGAQFNRVVVTLRTDVSGSQYDRLAHFYVAGNEVWRTSTIEPAGAQFFSVFLKDISDYATLLKVDNQFVFQLDNYLNNGQGAFSVQLDIAYYFESTQVNDLGDSLAIFSIDKPADLIYPLVQSPDSTPTPVVTIEDTLNLTLPTVPKNTTRLILRVFTSGNGDEEFWYFSSPITIKFINILYNGQKIGTQAAEPPVFTGAFTTGLWRPIVFNNDFDLPYYDFDLTRLLPYAWEGSSLSKKTSQVQISNGLGEIGLFQNTAVSKGWITSASILGYESDQVRSVSGSTYTATDGKSGDQKSDDWLVTEASFNAQLNNSLSIELSSGASVQVSTTFSSKSGMFNLFHHNQNTQEIYVSLYGRTSTSSQIQDTVHNTVLQVDKSDLNPLFVSDALSELSVTHLRSTTTQKNNQVIFDELSAVNSIYGDDTASSGNVTHAANFPSDSSTFSRQASSQNFNTKLDNIQRGTFAPINALQGPTAVNYANYWTVLANDFLTTSANIDQFRKVFDEFTNSNQ